MNILRLLLIVALLPLFTIAQTSKKTSKKTQVSKQVIVKDLKLSKTNIKDVVNVLTLNEKVHLVVGNGFHMPGVGGPAVGATQDMVPGAAGTTYAVPRLGIPSIVLADGPAGVRISPYRNKDSSTSFFATAFPVATLLASTWDTSLIRKVGEAFGNEVHEYGIDILLAPALNIHRNPLGGRNFEYYSEDPLVAGSIAAAIVNGIQSNGVGTSIKHFAANNQETNRNTLNTIVSERALREIYLKAFQITVQRSKPWTVMSSYNKINGTYTAEEYELLTTILRNEWNYKGFVMTDWFGGKDPVAQMNAGNDLLMPGTPDLSKRIMDAVSHDSLSIKVLDENVTRILNIIVQSPSFKVYAHSDKPDLVKHAIVSRTAAAEGMILLQNNNSTLPLTNVKKLAVFGNTSYDIIAGGTGSGAVNKAYTVSLVQGLANAGYVVQPAIQKMYESFLLEAKAKRPKPLNFFDNPKPIKEMIVYNEMLSQMANNTDGAIITIGRNAGEGNDRKVEDDFNLTDAEKDLIKRVAAAYHIINKKVIVILNIGGVIEMATWKGDADAIVLAWQPGLEAGNAIADILSGKVNPSGKLATTFPLQYSDVPSAKNFPGKEFTELAVKGNFGRMSIPAEVVYEDGIYVGYRYYDKFKVKPLYEFGYGLSYTQFKYSPITVSSKLFNTNLLVSLTITNTGSVAGKEVVQLYVAAPGKSMDKPKQELRGFAKTQLLQPGKSQTISFSLKASDIASFDTGRTSWVVEPGMYQVNIGSSSEKIHQSVKFNVGKEIISSRVHKVLVPQVPINEMK